MSNATEKPLAGKTVFVLEDEPLIAIDIEHMLYDAGASNVNICLNMIDCSIEQLNGASAAILDLNIRGNSSIPIAIELQKINIPTIFITGNLENTQNSTLNDIPCLIKPFKNDDLVACLANICEHA